MKSLEWKTYRTRFLVKAKQLSSSLTFVDHLGRQHCGRKGDYLVESYDGVLSIAPRQIFEDVYVPMSAAGQHDVVPPDENAVAANRIDGIPASELRAEALKIERIKEAGPRVPDPRRNDPDKLARPSRKAPQSVRATSSRLSLM
jgi:hypothetical protein